MYFQQLNKNMIKRPTKCIDRLLVPVIVAIEFLSSSTLYDKKVHTRSVCNSLLCLYSDTFYCNAPRHQAREWCQTSQYTKRVALYLESCNSLLLHIYDIFHEDTNCTWADDLLHYKYICLIKRYPERLITMRCHISRTNEGRYVCIIVLLCGVPCFIGL